MSEKWLSIPGYNGDYEVSNLGRVRSYILRGSGGRSDTPRPIGGGLNEKGYPDVTLWGQHRTIHRLVMLAFVGPCPDGQEVRHLDGSRDNSTLENLAYGTRKENVADSIAHGTKSGGSQVQTHCKRGHEFSDENTIHRPDRPTGRICRTCDQAYKLEKQRKAREARVGNFNARKTHCLRGHELAGDNLRVTPKGERVCRTCQRDAKAAWKARRRGEAA